MNDGMPLGKVKTLQRHRYCMISRVCNLKNTLDEWI